MLGGVLGGLHKPKDKESFGAESKGTGNSVGKDD